MSNDPSTASQVLTVVAGGVVGGGFALAGSWLTSNRTAHHATNRAERNELVTLAAELIRLSDAKWVGDIDYLRAVTSLGHAEAARNHGLIADLREQAREALRHYSEANDRMRSLVAEMRLRQPGIVAEAEALWQAAGVPDRSGGAGTLNPSNASLRAAETAFIDKVQSRMAELASGPSFRSRLSKRLSVTFRMRPFRGGGGTGLG